MPSYLSKPHYSYNEKHKTAITRTSKLSPIVILLDNN